MEKPHETGTSQVDIEAFAARYQNPGFWRQSWDGIAKALMPRIREGYR